MRLLIMFLALAGLVLTTASATMGVPFPLEIGETARLDDSDVTVTFVAVTQDSRCPRDIHCIVAGEAVVVVDVLVGEGSTELVFHIPPGGGDEHELDGIVVAVVALGPEADSRRDIVEADYVASVRVSPAE